MKLTYLGTAAAEGLPAVFCNCEFCREARKLRGKNIRTRSQAIVNDDLLLDFPQDTYMHFLNNNIEGDKIKYLFITHSHQDHLYADELLMRGGAFAHDMRESELKVYCGAGAYEKIINTHISKTVSVNEIKPYQKIQLENYTVTALPARHFPGDTALFYIIEGDKTILYAHDTGYFYDEVFEFIKENGYKFDFVSLDCTNIDIPIDDEGSHMGLDNIGRVIEKLTHIGAITADTKKFINHFSHNAEPIHHKLEERVKDCGYGVSYDGLSIEI